MSALVTAQTFSSSLVVPNMPVGRRVFIQTDVDLGVAWWDQNAQAYGPAETLEAPGGEARSSSHKALFTATGTAHLRITYVP